LADESQEYAVTSEPRLLPSGVMQYRKYGAVAASILAVGVLGFFTARVRVGAPPLSTHTIAVAPTPNVLLAVRDLRRLESTSYHMERVVELTDEQTRLWGLVTAKDAILLVAVGDVVAGVDLEKVSPGDVIVEWAKRSVTVRLPPAEIFSATLDNAKTHVYARRTDALAERNESLEGEARSNAEAMMKEAATDAGILDRAREEARKAIEALLRSLGFESVEISSA
jgi:hypothetical protein